MEIIGRQGAAKRNSRYRLNLQNSTLAELSPLTPGLEPLSSKIDQSVVALLSRNKEKLYVEFTTLENKILTRVEILGKRAHMSWIPDHSGVLLFVDQSHLMNVYLDGNLNEIALRILKDKAIYHPSYWPSGEAILFTERTYKSDIRSTDLTGSTFSITENQHLNYEATYSHDGDKVVYASVRNNNIHLWNGENGEETQLTRDPLSDKVESILWSKDDSHLIFKSGASIYILDRESRRHRLLLDKQPSSYPISIDNSYNSLVLLRRVGNTRNLWVVDINKQDEKQMTFADIGSVIASGSEYYFQYVDRDGVWKISLDSVEPKLVTESIPQNSRLLYFSNNRITYVTGARCRESDIFALDLSSDSIGSVIKRESGILNTHSFHPANGDLHTLCYLPESNIVLYQ